MSREPSKINAAAVGRGHCRLHAVCAASARKVLRKLPRRRGRGAEGARPDPAAGVRDVRRTVRDADREPDVGRALHAPAKPPPGFRDRGHADGRGLLDDGPEGLRDAGADDRAVVPQQAHPDRLERQAPRGQGGCDESAAAHLLGRHHGAPSSARKEIRSEPDPEFQGVDWLAVRPRLKNRARIVRPGPID